MSLLFEKYSRKKSRKTQTDETGQYLTENNEPVIPDLNSRFYGELLFRKSGFKLHTGNLTILNECTNRFFFRALFDHTAGNIDVSLIPALNAVAGRSDLDEAVRQEASVIASELEELKSEKGTAALNRKMTATEKKRFDACLLLAGEREPLAIDLLRLLRSNDIETRRTGMYLTGKFRFREFIPEICDTIDAEGLEYDAVNVLESFGETALQHLKRKLLSSTGNIKTTSLIAAFAAKYTCSESDEILLSCLFSHSKPALKKAAAILTKRKISLSEGERTKIISLAYTVASRLLFSLENEEAVKATGCEELVNANQEEMIFCYTTLSDLTKLLQTSEYTVPLLTAAGSYKGFAEPDDNLSFRQEEILRIKGIADSYFEKRAGHEKGGGKAVKNEDITLLLSKILDGDYIFSGIWLKACALRCIREKTDEEMEFSLSALLFSPWQLIAEEAALAAFRIDKKIYDNVAPRLPSSLKAQLDVLKTNPDFENLLYNRIKAVKIIFPGLPAEEALIIGEKARLISPGSKQEFNIEDNITGFSGRRDYFSWPATLDGNERILLVPWLAINEFMLIYPDRSGYVPGRIGEFSLK